MKHKLLFYFGILLIVFSISCSTESKEVKEAKSIIKEALNNINVAKTELQKAHKAQPDEFSDKAYKKLLAYGDSFYKKLEALKSKASGFNEEQIKKLVSLTKDVNKGTKEITNFLNNNSKKRTLLFTTKGNHLVSELTLIKLFFDSYIDDEFNIVN